MHDRGIDMKTEFFDTEWNQLVNTNRYKTTEIKTACPKYLDKLLDFSTRLSSPFPFVRCDFYIVDDRLYFGELTFTPAGGMDMAETRIDGKTMTEYLNISF